MAVQVMADLAQLWAQQHGKLHCKDGASCRQVCFTEPAAWQVIKRLGRGWGAWGMLLQCMCRGNSD